MALSGARPPVLVGFAEALSAVEAAWSLLDAGHPVTAFTRRGARPPLRRWPGVQIAEVTAPEDDAARCVEEVAAAARAHDAAAILPLDDHAVWVCARAAAGAGAALAGPAGELAAFALDKRIQLGAAAAAGLAVPATAVCTTPAEAAAAAAAFPVVAKPALAVVEHDGRLVRGAPVVCGDAAALAGVAARPAAAGPLLVQPHLRGAGEGLFGLATDSGVVAWSAHRRVRMMNPRGSGSSACEAVAVDGTLAQGVERMLAGAGWRGLFMAEFLRGEDGTPWLMELNGRPWGSMALARRAGLEYPAWAVAQALDPSAVPDVPPAAIGLRCRHLGRDLVHLLAVLRGPGAPGVPWPGRAHTARDVLLPRRGGRLYNWRRGAGRLLLDDTLATVRGALRGRRGA